MKFQTRFTAAITSKTHCQVLLNAANSDSIEFVPKLFCYTLNYRMTGYGATRGRDMRQYQAQCYV